MLHEESLKTLKRVIKNKQEHETPYGNGDKTLITDRRANLTSKEE